MKYPERILYFVFGLLLLLGLSAAHNFLDLEDTPNTYAEQGRYPVINASADGLAWSEVGNSFVMAAYVEKVQKNQDVQFHGDLKLQAADQPLNSSVNVTFIKGTGKLMIVPELGTDPVGVIHVHGTRVDRNTNSQEQGYIENITITELCTDASGDDAFGHHVWNFSDCYITKQWFVDQVNISTTNVDLTNLSAYHISFEQANDRLFRLNTADLNYYVINANAEIYSHFYVVNVTANGNDTSRVDVYSPLFYDRVSHEAFEYYRARSLINLTLDGSEDGFFFSFDFLPNAKQDFEQFDFKIWGEFLR